MNIPAIDPGAIQTFHFYERKYTLDPNEQQSHPRLSSPVQSLPQALGRQLCSTARVRRHLSPQVPAPRF